MHWFIDFDDTLSIGPMTWAFNHVIPNMIREYGLPYEPDLFMEATLRAQQEANQDLGDMVVMDNFLSAVRWPSSVKQPLLDAVFEGYKPALFDDALPLLERLRAEVQPIYVLSNNNHAPLLIEQFGVAPYFVGVFTPKLCGGLAGKPQREMLDYVLARHPIPAGEMAIVGDDPWSDGSFAETCGIHCWLLDRLDRYARIYPDKPYHWIRSLDNLTTEVIKAQAVRSVD